MSAAEVLKAEMAALIPVKKLSRSSTTTSVPPAASPKSPAVKSPSGPIPPPITSAEDVEIPGLGGLTSVASSSHSETNMSVEPPPAAENGTEVEPAGDGAPAGTEDSSMTDGSEPRGVKRSIDEAEDEEAEDAEPSGPSDEEDAPGDKSLALKVNPDGTVEQEDTVKWVLSSALRERSIVDRCVHRLWEPGYRERYYRQKFGVEFTNATFRKQ